jgi:hypothetical protein
MIDGYNFNGAKAYKDSKLAIMMFANALHERYHRATGIAFSSIYPGCIAESPLFREKVSTCRQWSVLLICGCMDGFRSKDVYGFVCIAARDSLCPCWNRHSFRVDTCLHAWLLRLPVICIPTSITSCMHCF